MFANRLKEVKRKLVSKYQIAGVEGRHIQENILLSNELLDLGWLNKEPSVMYKNYFCKAFDHISWNFLITC